MPHPVLSSRPRSPRGLRVRPGLARAVVLAVAGLAILTGPPTNAGTADAATRTLDPASFGAVGDGQADDTAALRRALEALRPGDTLALAPGKVYRHTDVLAVRTADVRIVGRATLLATEESRSSVFVDADRVEVDDVTFAVRSTTQRWGTFDQMKLRLGERSGIVLRRVRIDGSAAAGLYLWGTSDFLVEDIRVRDTRADGIHVTGTTHDGTIRRATIDRSGDDGVGVVSYLQDKTPVKRVVVDDVRVRDNTWGRGLSVVGGEDITYRHVYVRSSSAAAVYVASEGSPWFTFAPVRVKVSDVRLRSSNTAASVDHGALLVYSGNPGYAPRRISVKRVDIRRTRATASSQVGVLAEQGCTVVGVRLDKIRVRGGGAVFRSNVPGSAVSRTRWKVG